MIPVIRAFLVGIIETSELRAGKIFLLAVTPKGSGAKPTRLCRDGTDIGMALLQYWTLLWVGCINLTTYTAPKGVKGEKLDEQISHRNIVSAAKSRLSIQFSSWLKTTFPRQWYAIPCRSSFKMKIAGYSFPMGDRFGSSSNAPARDGGCSAAHWG